MSDLCWLTDEEMSGGIARRDDGALRTLPGRVGVGSSRALEYHALPTALRLSGNTAPMMLAIRAPRIRKRRLRMRRRRD